MKKLEIWRGSVKCCRQWYWFV